MNPPADFSDEEMMAVLALTASIDRDRRNAFLGLVARALAASPARGAGVAHRIANKVQRDVAGPLRMSALLSHLVTQGGR
jgi:hypothetical protein